MERPGIIGHLYHRLGLRPRYGVGNGSQPGSSAHKDKREQLERMTRPHCGENDGAGARDIQSMKNHSPVLNTLFLLQNPRWLKLYSHGPINQSDGMIVSDTMITKGNHDQNRPTPQSSWESESGPDHFRTVIMIPRLGLNAGKQFQSNRSLSFITVMEEHVFQSKIYRFLLPLLSMQRASWEQGVAAQALLETYLFTSDAFVTPPNDTSTGINYLSLIHGLVHDSIVRQGMDGRLAVVLNGDGSSDTSALDPACIGESLHFLYDKPEVDQQSLRQAARLMLQYILNDCPKYFVRDPTSLGKKAYLFSHRVDAVQIWSDSVFMLPPFLASSAIFYSLHPDSQFDPPTLIRHALSQVILAREVLQADTGEWHHIHDFTENRTIGNEFWGVGNGWVCGGIIRLFRVIARSLENDPPTPLHDALLNDSGVVSSLRNCYRILQYTLDTSLSHIRPDGLFSNIIDNPTTFVETNLSQQLAYTIYRLLDLHSHSSQRVLQYLHLSSMEVGRSRVLKRHADLMFEAASEKVDKWGFVQGVCGSPNFDRSGTAAEGQAWAILMNVARAEYERHQSNTIGTAD